MSEQFINRWCAINTTPTQGQRKALQRGNAGTWWSVAPLPLRGSRIRSRRPLEWASAESAPGFSKLPSHPNSACWPHQYRVLNTSSLPWAQSMKKNWKPQGLEMLEFMAWLLSPRGHWCTSPHRYVYRSTRVLLLIHLAAGSILFMFLQHILLHGHRHRLGNILQQPSRLTRGCRWEEEVQGLLDWWNRYALWLTLYLSHVISSAGKSFPILLRFLMLLSKAPPYPASRKRGATWRRCRLMQNRFTVQYACQYPFSNPCTCCPMPNRLRSASIFCAPGFSVLVLWVSYSKILPIINLIM